ncbi:MAG: M24 family metallopeptidase [Erysipelotrichaceae bacterium]
MKKINRLRALLKAQGLDAALLSSPHNRFYVSGFTGSTGYVLVTKTNQYFLTDFRYYEQVALQCPNCELLKVEGNHTYTSRINEVIEREHIQSLGMEGDDLTYLAWSNLDEQIKAHCSHIPTDLLRVEKFDDEIEVMQKANDIACAAFEHIIGFVKPGMRELDVKNELERKMQELGATGPSFDTIVASGERGALPHGRASEKIIEATDFVTIDYGCIYEGYCSDITRTFAMSKAANEKVHEIYQIVLEAQLACVEACKPGASTKEIDAIARDLISERGYGDYFGHGLGHGLGVLVHEEPRLNWVKDTVLTPGMVITIEPGIYLPGIGGVRIEDDVLITEDGYRRLTTLPKDLIYISEK